MNYKVWKNIFLLPTIKIRKIQIKDRPISANYKWIYLYSEQESHYFIKFLFSLEYFKVKNFWSFSNIFLNTTDERKVSGRYYKSKKQQVLNNRNKTSFKEQLSLLCRRHIDFNGTVNEIYGTFLRTMTDIYDANFLIGEYILKDKDIKFTWISKRLEKFSKKKQKLYIKFLKTKTLEDEFKYKNYKSLFEKLRKKGKIAYYSKLLHKYRTDSERMWQVMKEITGKQKTQSNLLPREIKVK